MFKLNYDGKLELQPITGIFTAFLGEALANDPDVMYVDADLMALIGTRDIWKKYPDRVFNAGIQEANMVGVAAGFSLLKFKPYIHSFDAFVVRRAFDQIFTSVAYAGKTMHIIGTEPGIKQDYNGGTHMSFEDIALMRTIPNASIFEITDNAMLASILRKTKDKEGVFYYRVPMAEIAKIYSDDSDFEPGKGNVLCEGDDATVIACGALVPSALEAAKILHDEGVRITVVDMFTIKPLDGDLIKKCVEKTGALVTAENAAIAGGLGEAVSEFVTENCPCYMRHAGVRDEFGEVGPESYLYERYGFTAGNLVEKVKEVIECKRKPS